MRNVGAMIVIGLLLVVGLTAFLLWGPLGEKPGMRQIIEEGEAPEASSPAARGQPRAVGRRGGTGPAAGSESAAGSPAAAIPPSGAEVSPAPVTAGTGRFPTAADIAIGTERSKLQASFGKPSMRTTVVDGGRLLETFVYLRSEPDSATFVLLRNGRVVSANTTVY
jgi:hypothetical protein